MAKTCKKFLEQLYATFLRTIAPFYKLVYSKLFLHQKERAKKHVVLLITRAHDIELLINLHQKCCSYQDLSLSFWMVNNCAKREPRILDELKEKNISVEMTVSFGRLFQILNKLLQTDAFLSTVESTTAKHKLPYIVTSLANVVGVSTYTMQHGFENVGLSYCDEIHGPEVKFIAKTVLTWGPVGELPAWVAPETRVKSVAVGCPKKLIINKNNPAANTGGPPLIGIFDNLHWHRYDERYFAKFLHDLEATAKRNRQFRFILKSHPDSVRNRSDELTARLRNIQHVDIADMLGETEVPLTTPWLLSHALGVITTPSTIALDGALADVPVAVTEYGLNLDYYFPLTLLDNLDDWQNFLNGLTEESEYRSLKLQGENFLARVLIPGDPAKKILDMMTGQKTGRDIIDTNPVSTG
ncbi:MAG: hypothetical protein QNK24_01575 [Desulfuromusa sp.]|nr:hypothetical protein [Desulfuromusa sp.]